MRKGLPQSASSALRLLPRELPLAASRALIWRFVGVLNATYIVAGLISIDRLAMLTNMPSNKKAGAKAPA